MILELGIFLHFLVFLLRQECLLRYLGVILSKLSFIIIRYFDLEYLR